MAKQGEWQSAGTTIRTLAAGEVDLWKVELLQPHRVIAHLKNVLSADEIQRATRFKFDRHRRRFVVARAALRTILAGYLKIDSRKIVFAYQAHGKPKISDVQNRHRVTFNLSHSNEIAVWAVTKARAIGVDVEYRDRRLSDADRIARRFFSAREAAQFLQVPVSQKNEAFFNCWTRKEALIKAIGAGLTFPLRSFDVAFLPGEAPALLATRPDPSQASKWSLAAFVPAERYLGALALEGKLRHLAFLEWQAASMQ